MTKESVNSWDPMKHLRYVLEVLGVICEER